MIVNVASNQARDAVAEWLGTVFGGIGNAFEFLGAHAPVVLIGTGILFTLWRLSVTFGPKRLCSCGGKGHVSGLLGGRRRHKRCNGSGLLDRIGSGK
jgi:hypothetical protein